jgi:hypothetical protein
MTYVKPTLVLTDGPFNQSTRTSSTLNGQMTEHTASWVRADRTFDHKALIFGSIYTDYENIVLGPVGLVSADIGTSRTYYGTVITTAARACSDDVFIGWGDDLTWQTKATQLASNPTVDHDRTRINAVRVTK